MSDSVISIEHLSKRYIISSHRQAGDGLSHAIERALRSPASWIRRRLARHDDSREEFWALRDVSIEVRRGDVIGIIGRNGAGKSTLLKILSRITEPTAGRARIRGRVASLLEVGTGFHPELTGRENIFLNGAILGMTRSEMLRKFDEITAFAEVERFLDTPVKRYSSGMQVRLAFAVAAHLEPEVLIVDEVLAVGDSAFQKKCLGKMRDVSSQEGRTVLFVSHNVAALSTLCTRGVVLEGGTVQADTDIHSALNVYRKSVFSASAVPREKLKGPRIQGVTIDEAALRRGELELRIAFTSPFELDPPIGGAVITDSAGTPLFGSNALMHPDGFERRASETGVLVCRIPRLPLHSGEYAVSVWLADRNQVYDSELGMLTFHYVSPDFRPETASVSVVGPINVQAYWRLELEEDPESVPVRF